MPDAPNEFENRIINDFGYHPATEETKWRHEFVRDTLKEATLRIAEIIPQGRDSSLFVTHMESAMYAANAAIARGMAPLEGATEESPARPPSTLSDEELQKPF